MGIVIRRLCRERFVVLLSDFVTYLNFTASKFVLVSRGGLERINEDTFIYHYNALTRNIPEATGQFHGVGGRLEENENREIKNIKQQL